MSSMFFADRPTFDSVLATLEDLETEINERRASLST